MSDFGPTEQRLRRIEARMPGYPLDPMRLVRMTYHLQKTLRDRTNAALRQFDLADTSYMVLVILYGSAGETSTASALGEACHEKPANLTRVCDELAARGLIERGPKPGDRRCVMISLSERGRSLVEQAVPAVSANASGAFAGFSPAELAQMADFCTRALASLDRPA
jgi:MarR family transcriptional repressor of emrRAB